MPEYAKKSGKLFVSIKNSNVKSTVKLKGRKLVVNTKERSFDYQLTPFTTVSQSSPKANSEVTVLNITDLQTKNEKNVLLNSTLQLISPTKVDAEDWSSCLQHNIVVLSQSMFEQKLHRNEKEESELLKKSLHSIQKEVVAAKQKHLRGSSLFASGDELCCCGYLIRKNQDGQQFYQKPSIIFAILSTKLRQIIFHRSHDMDKIADVIACKVNASTEDVRVQEAVGNPLAISLYSGNQIKEVFVVSDDEQKQLWLTGMKKVLEDTATAPPDDSSSSAQSVDTYSQNSLIENLLNSGQGTFVIHSSSSEDEADDEGESDVLHGTMVIHGDGTMVVHDDGTFKLHDDMDMFSSTKVHDENNWEEPNIFGKPKSIFTSAFWDEPEANESSSHHNNPEDLVRLVNDLQARLHVVESMCEGLQEELKMKDSLIQQLEEENRRLKGS